MGVRKVGYPFLNQGGDGSRAPKIVSIIDDDEEMCCFIRNVLEESPDLRCLDAYSSAEQALSVITLRAPDIALVDICLPGMSGLECIRRLKTMLPHLHIVVLTGMRGAEAVHEASVAGCEAYLEKPFSIHQLLATLRFSLSREVSLISLREPASSTRNNEVLPELTFREQKVMDGLSRGLLYKEIATETGMSFALVHKLQNRVFQKFQARNRTEAVNIWRHYPAKHRVTDGTRI